jgi:hypothetical protein
MSSRTFVPGMRLVLKAAKRYLARWQVELQANLTEAQYTCLVATLAAITECLIALGEEALNP